MIIELFMPWKNWAFEQVQSFVKARLPQTAVQNVSCTVNHIASASEFVQRCEDSKVEPVLNMVGVPSEEQISLKDEARARRVFKDNIFAIFVNLMCGLYCLLHVPSIRKVLELTEFSDNPLRAFARYYDTVNHAIRWFEEPDERAASIRVIRLLHRAAFKKAVEKNMRVSQYEMILTQWAFIGPAILCSKNTGLAQLSQEDKLAYVKVIYFVGKDLGIADKYNLCHGNLPQVYANCKAILRKFVRPCMAPGEPKLALSMLQGIKILNPFVDPTAFRMWTRHLLCHESLRPTNLKSQVIYNMMESTFEYLYIFGRGPFRKLMNMLMRLNLYLAKLLFKDVVSTNKRKYKM